MFNKINEKPKINTIEKQKKKGEGGMVTNIHTFQSKRKLCLELKKKEEHHLVGQ